MDPIDTSLINHPAVQAAILLLVAVLVLVAMFRSLRPLFRPSAAPSNPEEGTTDEDAEPEVDPWALQRFLMQVSGQELPGQPAVTRTTLLYWALKMEEMAETGTALHKILVRGWDSGTHEELLAMRADISSVCARLTRASVVARRTLDRFEKLTPILPSAAEAVELLDGTTDETVVNSGFALATGLPGSRAYLAVLTSNLSKRNPKTGVIDKDAGGKWIKGPDYQQPDLLAVLGGATVVARL